MNVMIAATYSAPKSGNFIPSVIALGRLITRNGGTAVYVVPEERDWADWIRKEGFDIVITGKQTMKSDNQIELLKQLIEKYQIDIIHLHFGMFHHVATHHTKELKDVKIIIHDHMGFSPHSNMLKQRLLLIVHSLEYVLKGISLIAVQKKKAESYLLLRKKWYIPNGLSLERNIDYSMTREECRETLGVKPSDKVCLLLGWDMKRKGFDIALKAIKKCRKMDSDIVLGLIGLGQGAPDNNTREFMARETPDIDPDEPWIKYFNNYEDIFAVYRAVEVYLMASRNEGLPYSVLEAISQDTPIVVSDIHENRFAKSYSNSYYYPVEEIDACAEAIMKAMKTGFIETNSAEFLKKYGVDEWCQRILEVYDIVTGK